MVSFFIRRNILAYNPITKKVFRATKAIFIRKNVLFPMDLQKTQLILHIFRSNYERKIITHLYIKVVLCFKIMKIE